MVNDGNGTEQAAPKTYEIRTLRDVFNLPTIEAIETCLREIEMGMVAAKATINIIEAAAKGASVTLPPGAIPTWPECMTWIDDGKGKVVAKFIDQRTGKPFMTATMGPDGNKVEYSEP